MNKGISLILVLLLLTTGTLFAKKKKALPELRKIIPLTELTPEMIEELVHDGMPDVAIECASGLELSPKFTWDYGVITALLNPSALLKINKLFYFRVNRKKAYVSHDLISWQKPEQWMLRHGITKVRLGSNKSDVLVDTRFENVDESDEY